MLISLSSSGLVAPSFFLNPLNNVNYSVAVQTPIVRVASVPRLLATPHSTATGGQLLDPGSAPTPAAQPEAAALTLGNVASVSPGASPGIVSHYTVQRILDVAAGVEGRDLGSVVGDIRGRIRALGPLPAGMRITVRGQGEVMTQSFRSLALGLILAIVLVYCLMVVLMTALAMVLGMIPMALGFGEGGEQNAPLGRAVIGGLAGATLATLLVVPVVYSLIRTKEPTSHLLDERFLAEERGEG